MIIWMQETLTLILREKGEQYLQSLDAETQSRGIVEFKTTKKQVNYIKLTENEEVSNSTNNQVP